MDPANESGTRIRIGQSFKAAAENMPGNRGDHDHGILELVRDRDPIKVDSTSSEAGNNWNVKVMVDDAVYESQSDYSSLFGATNASGTWPIIVRDLRPTALLEDGPHISLTTSALP